MQKLYVPDKEANDYWQELTFLNNDTKKGNFELDICKWGTVSIEENSE